MESDLVALKEELARERKRRIELEEECDLLSLEVLRLNGELDALKDKPASGALLQSHLTENSQAHNPFPIDDLLVEGDGQFYKHEVMLIKDACGGKNCLSVGFVTDNENAGAVIAGGADNMVHVYGLMESNELFQFSVAAPVLSIDCNGPVAACSCMDGSHYVIDFSAGYSQAIVNSYKNHSKYAICIKWSLDGQFLAVASHDMTVTLYKRIDDAIGDNMSQITCIRFQVQPECLVFAPRPGDPERVGNSMEWDLVVGLRDKYHLVYVDCGTLSRREISLNVNEWDTHVSFTPLCLCLSPDSKYVVVATDKGQHISYVVGTNIRVRCFASHACNAYGKPKIFWHGNYLYSLTDDSSDILVYSVASERIVHRLAGHRGAVRDIICYPHGNKMASVSFDKSVRVWS